jgi:hypothetical protein
MCCITYKYIHTYEVTLSAAHLMDTRSQNTWEAETQGQKSPRHSPLNERIQRMVWGTITYQTLRAELMKPATNSFRSGRSQENADWFGRAHWNKDYRMCTGYNRSRDSVVGIATGYGLDNRGVGVRIPARTRIFTSPRCPHRLWGLPSLLYNGHRVLFLRG